MALGADIIGLSLDLVEVRIEKMAMTRMELRQYASMCPTKSQFLSTDFRGWTAEDIIGSKRSYSTIADSTASVWSLVRVVLYKVDGWIPSQRYG